MNPIFFNVMVRKISFKLVDETVEGAKANVTVNGKEYRFHYPCQSKFKCTDYELTIPPGIYKFELYGASGGHWDGYISSHRNGQTCYEQPINSHQNVQCDTTLSSVAGAGGYTSGIVRLYAHTKAFISVGGQGQFGYKITASMEDNCYLLENMVEGGYNGGGYATNYFYVDDFNSGAGSGGGATDVRFDVNDLFHRVIVAGGGGGMDNTYGFIEGHDDGTGGAGGGLTAQGFFVNGVINNQYVATQTNGFTFGSGESAQQYGSRNENGVRTYGGNSDRSGSGGGWFGGFASHEGNAGAGGGSSFILTSDAQIPEGEIEAHDSFYNLIGKSKYAFLHHEYLFTSPEMEIGVWDGNGLVVITDITRFTPIKHHNFKKFSYFKL